MNETMFSQKEAWLRQFAGDCVTVGQDVRVVRGDVCYPAHADGIGPDGELLVTRPDGTREAINSGEVSIRGMAALLRQLPADVSCALEVPRCRESVLWLKQQDFL